MVAPTILGGSLRMTSEQPATIDLNMVENLKAGVDALNHIQGFVKQVNEGVDNIANNISNIPTAPLVKDLADPTTAARLEKGFIGSIKTVTAFSFFLTIWIPGQFVSALVGGCIITNALIASKDPSRMKKMEEGADLAWAPTRWLVNLSYSAYQDIQQARTREGEFKQPKDLIATFYDAEASMSLYFDIKDEEIKRPQRIFSGICKTIIAIKLTGLYFVPSILGLGVGAAVVGASFWKGKDIKHGVNIMSAFPTTVAALWLSASKDFYIAYNAKS